MFVRLPVGYMIAWMRLRLSALSIVDGDSFFGFGFYYHYQYLGACVSLSDLLLPCAQSDSAHGCASCRFLGSVFTVKYGHMGNNRSQSKPWSRWISQWIKFYSSIKRFWFVASFSLPAVCTRCITCICSWCDPLFWCLRLTRAFSPFNAVLSLKMLYRFGSRDKFGGCFKFCRLSRLPMNGSCQLRPCSVCFQWRYRLRSFLL